MYSQWHFEADCTWNTKLLLFGRMTLISAYFQVFGPVKISSQYKALNASTSLLRNAGDLNNNSFPGILALGVEGF